MGSSKNILKSQKSNITNETIIDGYWNRCQFVGLVLKYNTLRRCLFSRCTFIGCDLRHNLFEETRFENCFFKNCVFDGSSLRNCYISDKAAGTTFSNCDLTGADLRQLWADSHFDLAQSITEGMRINAECHAIMGELIYQQCDTNEKRAWALFMKRSREYCREHFIGDIYPEHLREWGYKTVNSFISKKDNICDDSWTFLRNRINE